jgi:hypothetical protein
LRPVDDKHAIGHADVSRDKGVPIFAAILWQAPPVGQGVFIGHIGGCLFNSRTRQGNDLFDHFLPFDFESGDGEIA